MNSYLDAIGLIDRLHSSFFDVVKLELDGLGVHDINNTQAVMLFNLGDVEMTVGELTARGCYLGSNVSYNVKKMVEHGYLIQERSIHDRRSIRVRVTEKGGGLVQKLAEMHKRHIGMLSDGTGLADTDLQTATTTMRRLERFWMRARDLHAFTNPVLNTASQKSQVATVRTGQHDFATRPAL